MKLLPAVATAMGMLAAVSAVQAADPNLARNLAATCANCHGTNGRSCPGCRDRRAGRHGEGQDPAETGGLQEWRQARVDHASDIEGLYRRAARSDRHLLRRSKIGAMLMIRRDFLKAGTAAGALASFMAAPAAARPVAMWSWSVAASVAPRWPSTCACGAKAASR